MSIKVTDFRGKSKGFFKRNQQKAQKTERVASFAISACRISTKNISTICIRTTKIAALVIF
jgi:hypothetical protein